MEVRGAALARNVARIREVLSAAGSRGAAGSPPGILAMVKADAYGTGVAGAVEALSGEGVAGWGVATVDEALQLRALGVIEPVQVFSPLVPDDLVRAIGAGIRPSVSGPDLLDGLPGGIEGTFDLELDTGMGRAGVVVPGPGSGDLDAWAAALTDRLCAGPLRWDGVFTHLHSADVDGDAGRRSVVGQISTFRGAVAALDRARSARGLDPLRTHVANSAGVLRFPELAAGFHAVRPGIALYGGGAGREAGFEEVAAVRARVVRVAEVPTGATAGYGATYRASGPERWATLGIGYGDGLPRLLSNRGSALVAGRRAPIIGRISMDMTVVDVTHVPAARVGSVATLVGSDGGERITLDELAGLASTIDYEILTGWTARLPRVRVEGTEG
jgi:alanine racemase